MKQVQAELGGRPFANDDLETLQQELTDAVQAQFLGKGPFILAGCVVSGPATAAIITAGIVCLDGQLLRFAGASGVALPAQLQAGAVVLSDPRPYQTGGTKYCMREVPAELVASNPAYTGGEFLPLDVWGGKTWAHVHRASVRVPKEVGWVAAYNPNDYDAAGVGKPGSEAWGWALVDGQSGRVDLLGRTAVAFDPTRPDYDTIGKQGGTPEVTLSLAEMPRHDHTGGVSQARFAYLDGHVTLDSNTDDSATEPNLSRVATIQPQGGGQAHENRMPFTTLLARVWVGY